MKFEKDNKNKIEVMVNVSIQLILYMTKKEVDKGTEIPHDMIVSGCVDRLAGKEYEANEELME